MIGIPAVSTIGGATDVDDSGDDTAGIDVCRLDYDQYDDPADCYRVWTCDDGQASFTTDHQHSGDQALEIGLEGGDSCGTNTHFNLEDELGYQPRRLYDRFYIRLPEDWTMAPNDQCKISRAALSYSAGDGHSGGGVPNGQNGWSAGLVVANRGNAPAGSYNLAAYVYHMDGGRDNSGPWESTYITPGEWHQIEQYVEVNSTENGQAVDDGVHRVWVDGELGYERTNYRWTTAPETNAIEYCGPYIRYGGGEVAPETTAVHFDDHFMVCGDNLNIDTVRSVFGTQ